MAKRHIHLDDTSKIAGIAALSAVVGALTAMLITPKSGADNRKMIRNHMQDMKNGMDHMSSDLKSHISSSADVASRKRHIVTKKTKDMLDSASDEADHIRKHGER